MGYAATLRFCAACLLCTLLVTSCEVIAPTVPALIGAGADGDDDDDGITRDEKSLHFVNVRTVMSKPSQVQFYFALRDNSRNPITISAPELAAGIRILENGSEIELSETTLITHTAERTRLDLVLVLDFTNSMASWAENGENGIETMIAGVEQILRTLSASHRAAILEYHDRSVGAGVISYFSSDSRALMAALYNFAQSPIDHGSSRSWDAVASGLALFSEDNEDQSTRVLVVFSDGLDTSSEHKPDEVTALARKLGTEVYVIATGDETQSNMENLCLETGGIFYSAQDFSGLEQQIVDLALALKSHYLVSYLTLKTSGSHKVRLELQWENEINSIEKEMNLGEIYEDDRVGVIAYEEAAIIAGRAEVLFRVEHSPRNVDRFRFRFNGRPPDGIALVARAEGGLCEGWLLTGPDLNGYFDLMATGGAGLAFGDLGYLFRLVFENVRDSLLTIPCEFDNQIYPNGKRFSFPQLVYVGLPTVSPEPAHGAVIDTASTRKLSWQVINPRELPLRFEVFLDAVNATQALRTDLTSTSVDLPKTLLPNTTYYWRVAAYSSRVKYDGPVWRFKTE